MGEPLKAPFPWFGGKRRVAAVVWERLGDVDNYVEPFAGSLAVLLARPTRPKTETANDVDHYVTNFWRAVQWAPDAVAEAAWWPVNEADLHAREAWLVSDAVWGRLSRMAGDWRAYDAEIAGVWCWGACIYIGSGWCSGQGPWVWDGDAGEWVRRVGAGGVSRQLPDLGRTTRGGENNPATSRRGINRQLPRLSGGAGGGAATLGSGVAAVSAPPDRRAWIRDWMRALSERLYGRDGETRIACGDWTRVCTDALTWRHGVTGVFLDPPYADAGRAAVYAHDCRRVALEVRAWALEAGRRPDMRIALCGYEGEHDGLERHGWSVVAWKAAGGYGSQGDGQARENAARERIWFSPHCLDPRRVEAAGPLFAKHRS